MERAQEYLLRILNNSGFAANISGGDENCIIWTDRHTIDHNTVLTGRLMIFGGRVWYDTYQTRDRVLYLGDPDFGAKLCKLLRS